MALRTLEDALVDELRDLLSAEQQIVEALPKLAEAASSPALKQAFENHLAETETHVERAKQALKALGKSARAKTCKAAEGLIEEGNEVIEVKADPSVKDAFLIAAGQKVEHYEIASYGTVRAWAQSLGLGEVVALVSATLKEEEKADALLNKLALTSINPKTPK